MAEHFDTFLLNESPRFGELRASNASQLRSGRTQQIGRKADSYVRTRTPPKPHASLLAFEMLPLRRSSTAVVLRGCQLARGHVPRTPRQVVPPTSIITRRHYASPIDSSLSTRSTVIQLLSSIGSKREAQQWLSIFSSVSSTRFAVSHSSVHLARSMALTQDTGHQGRRSYHNGSSQCFGIGVVVPVSDWSDSGCGPWCWSSIE